MLVRSATSGDIPAIRALEQQSETAAHWAEREYAALFSPDAPARLALVATAENDPQQVYGFVVACCTVDDWEVENIVVTSEQRHRGVGSAMMRELFSRAESAGATSVLLEVRESNTAACLFYEALGFKEEGRRSNYYQDPQEDALLFRFSVAVL